MSDQTAPKITYTTLSADNDAIHEGIEEALERAKSLIGNTYPLIIGGEERTADETFPVINPANTEQVLFHFQNGTAQDTRDAIAAAREAFPEWSRTPWEERVAIVERANQMIQDNIFDIAAVMMLEIGKNRLEALAETAETVDLVGYYIKEMRRNNGYVREMESQTGSDHNMSVMKPYGVWGVIAPFNFPIALAAAPVGAALLTGNTVVIKPTLDAPWAMLQVVKYYYEAGLPEGCLSYITGPDETAASEIVTNPDVDGITFTGSYEVGYELIYQRFPKDYPKPVVAEMGGKNPVLISPQADLDKAAMGVMRGAFGFGGQKCSASSRVYVHRDVYEPFKEKLVSLTEEHAQVGDPLKRETFLGPVGTPEGYAKYQRFMEMARQDGTIVYGGEVLKEGDFENGFFVQPAIIEMPHDHELVKKELFLPIVAIMPVDSMDEAMAEANDSALGLCAGIFTEDESEIDWFLQNIQAGVVYANRSGGATTGAWPGHQTFGGWKGSGSTGKNIFGHYSLLAYMREQSRTVYRE
ncbi:MAG: aldehyde dehydrogenase family protein [Chloroflexi bacterium]|nr:aldehyde dehydrogenase family protein [Chloroflexota bacterium]